MQTFFMLSLGAASLGGAVALTALFYYARMSRKDYAAVSNLSANARSSTVLRRDRAIEPPTRKRVKTAAFCDSTEMERRRAEMEELNYSVVTAARAIDNALEAAGAVFTCELASPAAFESAKPFKLNSFD